jgi:hypothetical protein
MTISAGVLNVNNITIQGGTLTQTGGQIISTGLLYLRYDSYTSGSVTVYVEGTANLTEAGNQFNQLEMKGSSRINTSMPTLVFSSALINGVNSSTQSFKAFVSGSSDLTITNNLTMERGVIEVTGNVVIGGILDCYGGNFGRANSKMVTVTGITNVVEGLSVLYATFLPNGGVNWTGGGITYSEMAVLRVPLMTVFTDATNTNPQSSIGAGNMGGTFDLQGQYVKNVNALTTINNLLLTGTMAVNAGRLMLGTNSNLAGDINAGAGTSLEINGGPVTQTAGLITCMGVLKHNSGNTILSNYNLNNVECNGGTLTLNMPTSTINTLSMSNSSILNGTTHFVFNGNVISSAGNASSGGSTISNTGDILFNQNLTLAHGAINNTGTVTVNGNFIWYGGGLGTTATSVMTINGTTSCISDAAISFPAGRVLKKTLILQGGGTWNAGGLTIENNGYLKIPAGQTFTTPITSDLTVNCQPCSAVSGVENLGTWVKSGSSRLTFEAPFINSGNLSINAGEVRLTGNLIHTLNGQVTSVSNTTLSIYGGVTTKNSGTLDCALLFIGGGELILNAGSTNTITNCFIQAGTLTINTADQSIGSLTYQNSGGILKGSTNLLVTGNMILTGVNAKLANTGTVTVNGNFTWNAGMIGPEVSAAGTMTVNGSTDLNLTGGNVRNYRTLILNGGGTWTAGGINLWNDGSIRVPLGATFTNTLNNDSSVIGNSPSATSKFEVLGIAEKTGTNQTTFGVPLVNSGTFNVSSGIINLTSASTLNGSINFSAGTELKITSGASSQTSGSMSCPRIRTTFGELVLNSSTNTLNECLIQGGRLTINNASQTIGSLSITASSIRGLADITVTGDVTLNGGGIANTGSMLVNGNFLWNQGTIGESGLAAEEVTVAGTSTFAITTTTNSIYRTVILNGNGTWTQGNMFLGLNGVLRIAPSSTFTENSSSDRSISPINGASIGSFQNQGIFNSTNGGNLAAASIPFSNSGVVNIQTGTLSLGSTVANSGTIKGVGTLNIATGTTYTNSGTFAPGLSPGILTHTGLPYTNSTLDFEIQESGGIVSKDLLNVTGNMTLGGTLNIQYLGGTVPPGTYDIAVCTGTRTGTFATINYPSNCNGNCSVTYTSNKAQLVLSASLPLELLEFVASVKDNDVHLKWRTTNETNVRNFDIQRSTDASTWEYIGIQTANNQKNENHYQFTDYGADQASPSNQKLYYRLKMNDLDGSFDYSPIVYAVLDDRIGLRAWPNPATSDLVLNYTATSETAQLLTVYGSDGRVVLSQRMQVQKGDNRWPIATDGWPSGMYRISLGGEVLELLKQ